ncbi:4'-phosphopantetheinyl transferase superfamily protein [Pseudoalteromonas sp. NBT06-2]|uniref:4'-phosphopantetheinyl transferase family protein n=1 Tax=Pseudoalteromonas sp. NBT06-2 TaxID=2025950 RepID=UPI0014836E11|nr:4'-phosphopantetheinyl transferase superfamily protein [Pseudoalteromonas sp. NBT06-2]
MEKGIQVINLLENKALKFDNISYYLNEQCNVPIVLIDLEHYKAQLIQLSWSNLLSVAEVHALEKVAVRVQSIAIERLTGRLAAKLALAALTRALLKECQILTSSSGQPYSACGRFISISHSGQYVVATASNSVIGIDIQKNKKFSNAALDMAFKTQEMLNHTLGSHTLIWTIKESFLKALGLGIFPHINNIELKKEFQKYFIETSSTYIHNVITLLGGNTQITTGSLSQYCYSITQIE